MKSLGYKFHFILLLSFSSFISKAQLFQQNFNAGTFVPAIVNCTSGQVLNSAFKDSINPGNSKFTYINTSVGSSCGTSTTINNGKIEITKTGNNAYFTRTVALSNPSPTSLLVRFDFEVLSNTASNTSAFNFYVGDGIQDNNSSSGWVYHTNFKIGVSNSGSLQWRVASTGAYVSGSHTVLLAVNKSGGVLSYLGPDGSCESVGTDKYDVWIDNVRYVNDATSINANGNQGLSKFAIVSNSGPASTCTFDNILIDPIPATPVSAVYTPLASGGIGFNANWTPVTGVSGYYIDLAEDASFTTNLTTTYVAGAASSTYSFTGLTAGATYYYRVRAASIYSVGTYQSCNSAPQSAIAGESLTFSLQPVGYSSCLGTASALTVNSSNAITYQWYSNNLNSNIGGTPIAGATSASFTPSAAAVGVFYYYCEIGRGSSTLASNVAVVNIVPVPTLTAVSQAAAVCGGVAATINLTGLAPNSTNIVYYRIGGGATQTALAVVASALGAGSFSFISTNSNNGQSLVIDSIRTACTSSFTGISTTLAINQSPADPTGGVTVNGCSAGTLTLSVNNPGGTFSTNWYSAATGGTLLASTTNSITTPSFSNDTTVTYYAQTFSPSTGCSSPIRVGVVGTLLIPDFTLTNNTIYSPVPLSPFNVNLPYSFATAGLDQYSITWTSANASTFPTVTNATLPASPVVLTLNASAVTGTYTGTIRVRNSATGCTTPLIPFTIVVIPVVAGDYGSVATGNWTATATWRSFNTTTGTFSNVVASPPASTTNVWIIGGYTVTAGTGGSCNDLRVLNGRLITGTSVTANQTIAVSGTVIEVADGGFIGNGLADISADGISLNINTAPAAATFVGGIAGTTLTVTTVSAGTIQVGQLIAGTGVIPGTFISALGTGTGGAGTYTVNQTNTVTAGSTLTIPRTTTISGSGGTIDLSKLFISRGGGRLIIDRDITINHFGTAAPAFYSNTNAGAVITINAGRTVTMSKWANMCLSTVPTNNQASVLTLNINGNLNFTPGRPVGASGNQLSYPTANGFLVMNSNAVTGVASPFTINIGSSGVLNAIELYTAGFAANGTAVNTINIAAGGVMNIDSIADFRKSNVVVSGGGIFNLRGRAWMRIGSPAGINASPTATGHIQTTTRNFSKLARYSYESRGVAQQTGTALDTAAVITAADTSSTLSLSKNIVVTDSLRITGGKLVTSAFTITTNLISKYADTNYVATTSTGYLRINNVGFVDVFFPIGPSTTSYNPITLSNAGTIDNFRVRANAAAISGMNTPPRSDSAVLRNWNIVEDQIGGSNLTITPQWNAGETGTAFSPTSCSVIHYSNTGGVVDYGGAVGPAVGSGPYTRIGSGFTNFLQFDQFGVGSAPKKYRSRQTGLWADFDTWDVTNPSGGYSASEQDYPNDNTADVFIQPTHVVTASPNTNTFCGNLFLSGTLALSALPSDNFYIGGSWTKPASGILNANDKPVIFNGSSNVNIGGSGGQNFAKLNIQKTALTNTITLTDSVSIGKELLIATGTLDLSSKNITLLSDSSYTASLGTMNANGAIIYSGTGRFVVERYIHTGTLAGQHGKSWQLLCSPVAGQTIKESWMENAPANQNPFPGYGAQIVGPGGATNGFDVATGTASIKSYNATTGSWTDLANTNQPVNGNKGFVALIRGDRSVITSSGAPTPTKLRSKGTLTVGQVTSPAVPANGFQSVANPYASAVDMSTVSRTGLVPFIYVFDPFLSNLYGLGAYQTIDLATGNATPGGTRFYSTSGDYRNIQSGQAFFVYAGGSGGSLTFNENNKSNTSRLATRLASTSAFNSASLSTQLWVVNANQDLLTDGNKVIFDDSFENGVDLNDARKFINSFDNFGLSRDGQLLSIETRKPVVYKDSIFYALNLSRIADYKLIFSPSQFNSNLISARLIDKYQNRSTVVSLTAASQYAFSVNADPASKANDRFILVFEKMAAGPLPVRFVTVKANFVNKNETLVSWTVDNQADIESYQIEKSEDGNQFHLIGSIDAIVSTSSPKYYQFTDITPTTEVAYYRIKALGLDASVIYSQVVKLNTKEAAPRFSIRPNPVSGNIMNLFAARSNEGPISFFIYDLAGQQLLKGEVNFDFVNRRMVALPSSLIPGSYLIKLQTKDGQTELINFIKK